MKKFLKYLWYVIRHKWFVFLECCKLGIPIRGILHDISKFRPSEFIPYMNHFAEGIDKGRDRTGYYKPENTGDKPFERAWFLHQKRNKHHWQYWCLPTTHGVNVLEMPRRCIKEMIADWRGAGRAQHTPGVLVWYTAHKKDLLLGTLTRCMVEHEIGYKEE